MPEDSSLLEQTAVSYLLPLQSLLPSLRTYTQGCCRRYHLQALRSNFMSPLRLKQFTSASFSEHSASLEEHYKEQ